MEPGFENQILGFYIFAPMLIRISIQPILWMDPNIIFYYNCLNIAIKETIKHRKILRFLLCILLRVQILLFIVLESELPNKYIKF
jgi:hypothetical protein